jgi:hypothetical protein
MRGHDVLGNLLSIIRILNVTKRLHDAECYF